MSSSIGIAALEAEIVSRKRNANHASAMAAPTSIPKKKAKLKMKYDKSKNPPRPSPTNMSAGTSEFGDETDTNDAKSSYSEVQSHLSLKTEIYNKLKADPTANVGEKIAANMVMDNSKDTYMYTDEEGNTQETPVNKLPNSFWQNINDSDEEENVDGRGTEYGDEDSRYGGGVGGASAVSQATTIKRYDGQGFSFMQNIEFGMGLGEVRHANTMTEDRRDYGALYYNLGLGADRVRRFEQLKELREETIKQRVNSNADSEHNNPLDRFTPQHASAYLQRLAMSKGKNLQRIKEQLYGHLL